MLCAQLHSEIARSTKLWDGCGLFIISPDYNIFDEADLKLSLSDHNEPNQPKFTQIHYSEILVCLEQCFPPQDIPDRYYSDFLRALKKHTGSGTLEYEMKERFIEAIKYKGSWTKNNVVKKTTKLLRQKTANGSISSTGDELESNETTE